MTKPTAIPDRFWPKVQNLPSGCWKWTSATSRGYPVLSVPPSRAICAVRIAWEIANGPLPVKARMSRTCREPLCVNPDHHLINADQRFWSKVSKSDGCWEWRAGRIGGYGRLGFMGRGTLAHRRSYEMAYGPIPDGLDVLHKCDNPPCVRPDHLFLGTDLDNQRDCTAKGRRGTPNAKMSADDVRAIRRSRSDALSLAQRYGVSRMTIYCIRQRRTWKNI